jgi:hypothetical protein
VCKQSSSPQAAADGAQQRHSSGVQGQRRTGLRLEMYRLREKCACTVRGTDKSALTILTYGAGRRAARLVNPGWLAASRGMDAPPPLHARPATKTAHASLRPVSFTRHRCAAQS